MRMSCNGCRVLRKGCSENCSIRPCLQWIKNPEAQANATVFLAKSYGRAGLMNLINAGPEHLRPAIFRSLLYEACGRIVNPIYGSVGLLWSGNWQLCQGAVEAVLKGAPIVSMPSDTAVGGTSPPMKAYDIRHVTKDDHVTQEVHNIKTRCRFKRVGKPKPKAVSQAGFFAESADHNPTSSPVCNLQWSRASPNDSSQAASHDSSTTHDSVAHAAVDGDSRETESMFSVETVEASLVRGAQPHCQEDSDVELELTLGFEPVHGDRSHTSQSPVSKPRIEIEGSEDDACMFHLGLEISA